LPLYDANEAACLSYSRLFTPIRVEIVIESLQSLEHPATVNLMIRSWG
jgi:hypothetical protein